MFSLIYPMQNLQLVKEIAQTVLI